MASNYWVSVWCTYPWFPWGLPTPVVIIIVILRIAWATAPGRSATPLILAVAELISAMRETAQAVKECVL